MPNIDQADEKIHEPNEKIPTVFMFQPTKYVILEGDRLQEWEKHMREDVGLNGQLTTGATGCVSLCGTKPERRDDCDSL